MNVPWREPDLDEMCEHHPDRAAARIRELLKAGDKLADAGPKYAGAIWSWNSKVWREAVGAWRTLRENEGPEP